MTIFWILLGLSLLALIVVRLVVAIRNDGYGVNPPPASHESWDAGSPDSFRRVGF